MKKIFVEWFDEVVENSVYKSISEVKKIDYVLWSVGKEDKSIPLEYMY